MRAASRKALALGLASALLSVAACGGDDGGDVGPPVDGALASVVRIDASVDARVEDATGFSSVDDPVAVNPGDDVRTDTTGFAEITYFDGSITRLDVETELTVTELADGPEASVVRTRMGPGRTWHRVEQLGGDDLYEVETAVATATVRGTAFVVTCDRDEQSCTFDVLVGSVDVTPVGGAPVEVGAGESVTVTSSGAGEPRPVDPALSGDDWIGRNVDLDRDAGFGALDVTDGEGGDEGDGAGQASRLDGDWVFVTPQELIPQEFTICAGGCVELLGSETNLAAEDAAVTVTESQVTIDPAQMSIPCTGGASMSHQFTLVLVADGPDRLVARGVAMPGGGCAGRGPATVDFVAERASGATGVVPPAVVGEPPTA